MSYFDPQNPGFEVNPFTDAEVVFLQDLVSLAYQQGDILYYDGSELNRLPAGTDGQFLKTQGVGFNPIWFSAFNGFQKITVSDTAPSSPSVGDLWVDTS